MQVKRYFCVFFSFPPSLPQHGVQLKQNYEDTKAEMPWLQLEDDNLDLVVKNEKKTVEVTSSLSPSHALVGSPGDQPIRVC